MRARKTGMKLYPYRDQVESEVARELSVTFRGFANAKIFGLLMKWKKSHTQRKALVRSFQVSGLPTRYHGLSRSLKEFWWQIWVDRHNSPDLGSLVSFTYGQALAGGRTNPIALMEFPDDGEEYYSCQTQKSILPTYAEPPPSKSNTEGDAIVVGFGPRVPRWGTIEEPKGKLLYCILKESFPESEDDWVLETATTDFKRAADAWNNVDFGLSIVATNKKEEAHFYLRYVEKDPESAPGRVTDAEAFFPHQADKDVIVYYAAFRKSGTDYLEKVFIHELGHVLGLRHEFALQNDNPETDSKGKVDGRRIFGQDPLSIMGYRKDKALQQSDKDGLREFYKLAEGTVLGRSPVTDYMRDPRKI